MMEIIAFLVIMGVLMMYAWARSGGPRIARKTGRNETFGDVEGR